MPKINGGKTKKEQLAQEVARIVGAGRPVAVETVDFADPNRPKTCLEVDFPIIPVNQVAVIEGNAGKPVYQMSKWWARRRSSVFRSMLIAAATKAPDDPAQAAKTVWDVYYANLQKRGTLKHLKVSDIFMGGGTTIVEGARLGMQMHGVELNPVAWFIVKNELARVDLEEVKALLADIEAEVKPQIMPFYACDCPRGHKGRWMRVSTGEVMGDNFDPFELTAAERKDYSYSGPEIIYVFWAKHGPCQVTGCGHRTPIMSSPVVAIKTMTVKAWEDLECPRCAKRFDVEAQEARMAPGVPLVVAATETPCAVIQPGAKVTCPHCGAGIGLPKLGKPRNKKVELSLLVHPSWLAGTPGKDLAGREYGGSATDTHEATAAWNRERARQLNLIEVRGELPEAIEDPETGETIRTTSGTVPKKSTFACGHCGNPQDVLESVRASGKTGPVAAYAIQGFCPACESEGYPYSGRFFAAPKHTGAFDAANREWDARRDDDLRQWWPKSELPYGFMTSLNNGGLPNHGYTHWWTMFNPRQLLVHTELLRAICEVAGARHRWATREYVLGGFQQFLRNESMFSFWHLTYDKLAPALSNANFHPKANMIEVGVFCPMGYGPWSSTIAPLIDSLNWQANPWERLSVERLSHTAPTLAQEFSGKSVPVSCGDPAGDTAQIECASATDLSRTPAASVDLVLTDPPFGGLLHYSELSDFFHVWLRLPLKEIYPDYFAPEYTPKVLEVVSNRARHPADADDFYKRLLTECWREAHRILKAAGILAFTFHHSEDEPWVDVLESLFDAGFYLEATYPIRSDETKGEGSRPGTFGSQKIEYDIIHVCRKRTEDPQPVSWGRMRREVLEEVRRLQQLLEHHAKEGLPAADLQVIKRGKALEYFSRHYGKVLVDEDKPISVRDAVAGIIQLLDEQSGAGEIPPPVTAEPFTRQFLRIFAGRREVERDQMQKVLRGTGIAPDEFEARGWCREVKKVHHLVSLLEIARDWAGKHRRRLTTDYDQAAVLIGACFDGSGINAQETLRNENFKPHPALGSLLEWHAHHAAGQEVRNAASRAMAIYRSWAQANQQQMKQLSLFFEEEE